MTKPYHLTQEQAIDIWHSIKVEGTAASNIHEFANTVLDKVLGEPVAWMYQTKDFTGTAYAITQKLPEYEYANEVPLYAPKELT